MSTLDIRDATTFDQPVFTGPDAPASDDLAQCIHCGLCLNYCPTYRITGLETESPRGRIYLMAQWEQGTLPYDESLAGHIDMCLGCRACEAVCPSGVPYGRIIEHGRAEVDRLRPADARRAAVRLGMRELLPHPGRLRALGRMTRLAQRLGLTRLVPAGRQLPPLRSAFRPPRGNVAPAIGPRRHRVAFLTGCVMPLMYPEAHLATVRLLQRAGCEVWFPPDQTCCGALFAHNGDLDTARRLRETNANAFGMESFDAVVVNSAGCGAHMKDFYPNLGPRTLDLAEFLTQIELPPPAREVRARVVYQDACHLVHAQGVRNQPRALLEAVPGLELVELAHPDICCGAAGLYSTLQPDMAQKVLAEKLDDIGSRTPQVVVTANPGCQMHIQSGLRARGSDDVSVLHLAELLDLAYD